MAWGVSGSGSRSVFLSDNDSNPSSVSIISSLAVLERVSSNRLGSKISMPASGSSESRLKLHQG